MEFLAHQFKQGKSYRSLNVYRSAISSTSPQIDGVSVGQHPLIVKLVKGAFHLRPPNPKYGATWPVHKVVLFLKKLGPSAKLTLKWLSWKLAILIALALACRCSELQMIEVSGIFFDEQGVKIILQGLTKTSYASKPSKQFTIELLKEEPLVCPVITLKQYLSKTRRLRDTPQKEKKLFISYVKPHKPVTTPTIDRWIMSVLTARCRYYIQSSQHKKCISISSHKSRCASRYNFANSRLALTFKVCL